MTTVLASDLGGTNVRAALIDRSGRLTSLKGAPLPRPANPRTVLAALESAFLGLLRAPGPRPSAVSLSFKGLVDPARGLSRKINGFDGWSDVPVAARLKKKLGLPVLIENDARCAALGELWRGRARGRRDFVFVIVGTGIGTGLVRDGRLYRGPRGHAGEFGHMTIDDSNRDFRCACGHFGHWEGLAAGPSLGLRAERLLERGHSGLERFLERRGGKADGAFVTAALRAGVPAARKIVAEAGRFLGLGLYNVARAEDPSLIVVGGGAAANGAAFLAPARRECARRLAAFDLPCPEIVASSLGDHAGLLGAAARAFKVAD